MTTFWVTAVAAKCGGGGCWTHADGLVVLPFTGSNANGIYRAVNESALLNITAAGSVYEVRWLRDSKKLLRIKDKKVKYYVNKDQCRCKIFLNGTLQIEQVMKEDSGNYTVTVYQQDGKLKAEEVMNLVVQGEFCSSHTIPSIAGNTSCSLLQPFLLIAPLSVLGGLL